VQITDYAGTGRTEEKKEPRSTDQHSRSLQLLYQTFAPIFLFPTHNSTNQPTRHAEKSSPNI
jgi:hypothetical protein